MPASFTSMDSESEITSKGNPLSIHIGRKPLYHQLDLAASYEANFGDHSALFRVGVENVFDRAPSSARLEIGYDPYVGNPYGRLYTFGITVNY
jgi:outer membrane receptor protein involved in Fe transport